MIDFARKVYAFKETLQLWYVKVENKKFAFLLILNKSIEELHPEPDLMALVSFLILNTFTL